jgi:MFS-type transporter involved in bile tolerance (Atg22 family)
LVKTTIFKLKWGKNSWILYGFHFSSFGVPVPPVVTLYLALIFTAVARPKDAWHRREPPESVADIDAPPALHL